MYDKNQHHIFKNYLMLNQLIKTLNKMIVIYDFDLNYLKMQSVNIHD